MSVPGVGHDLDNDNESLKVWVCGFISNYAGLMQEFAGVDTIC